MYEQEPNNKKKKKKPGLLSEKMGLDRGSDMFAPPRPQPGILSGSAAEELNSRTREEGVGQKIDEKLRNRKQNG